MIYLEINYQIKVPQRFETLFNKVAQAVSRELSLKKDFNISVAVVSPQKIKQLNQVYRQHNKVTDVLSFPEVDEIVICYQEAVRQQTRGVKKQLAWLFCHGLLHLLGFDHQSDREERQMRGLEQKILHNIG